MRDKEKLSTLLLFDTTIARMSSDGTVDFMYLLTTSVRITSHRLAVSCDSLPSLPVD